MAEEAATTTETTQATGTETKAAETTETKAAEATQAAETQETKSGETTETKIDPVDYAKVMSEAPMPEGMTLDPALAKTGGELLAKHKITADAAKELVSFFAQQQKAGADGNAKAFATQVQGWKAEAEKSTTAEERGTAKDAALKVFGKDEVALLEHFGVTNRASFIKAMAKIGKAVVANDTFVPGNAGAANGARDARSHFPNSNMNP